MSRQVQATLGGKMRVTILEKKRREHAWTKAELARRAKMQGSTIGWIEEGRFKPYDSQLKKLAEQLEVADPHKLLDISEA